MKEHAGQAAGPIAAEIIKVRLVTLQEFQDQIDSLDLDNMDDWIYQGVNGKGIFLMNHHMLPSVATALTYMIMTVKALAANSEEPGMAKAVEVAIQSAYRDFLDQQ